MAVRIGSLEIFLNVNTSGMGRFGQAARTVEFSSARMQRALDGTSTSVSRLRREMGYGWRMRMFGDALRTVSRTNDEIQRLRALLVGTAALFGSSVTSALGATYLVQAADTYKRIHTQMAVVIDDATELAAAEKVLFDMSQRTRTGYAQTVNFYARLARSTKNLAIAQSDLLRITETVQKTLVIGGATTQEAQSAAVQLGQGLASDRLSGDELKSILENAPRLAQAIAEGMGVGIGRLREMGAAGELTARKVTDALLKMGGAIDEEFSRVEMTVAQAMTNVDSAITRWIGQTDQGVGATRALAEAIDALAKNFVEIADVAILVGGALGALGLGRFGAGRVGASIGGFGGIGRELERRKAFAEEIRKDYEATIALIGKTQANIVEATARQQQFRAATLAAMRAGKSEDSIFRGATAYGRATTREAQAKQQLDNLVKQRDELDKALRAAEQRATRVQSALSVIGGGILGFFGGATGLAITSLVAGLGVLQIRAAQVAEQTARVNKIMADLGVTTGTAATQVTDLAEAFLLAQRATLRDQLKDTEDVIERTRSRLESLQAEALTFAGVSAGLNYQTPFAQANRQLASLIDELLKGEITAEAFNLEVARIADANFALKETAAEVLDLGRTITGASNAAEILRQKLAQIGNTDLSSVTAQLQAMLQAYGEAEVARRATIQGIVDEELRKAGRSPAEVDLENEMDRLRQMFSGADVAVHDDFLRNLAGRTLALRAAAAPRGGGGRGGGRGGGGGSRAREIDEAQQVIDALEQEIRLLQMTEVQREIENNLRRAGAAVTEEQRKKITELTQTLIQEQEALERSREAWSNFSSSAKSAIEGIISDIQAGKGAIEILTNAIQKLADRILSVQLDSMFDALGSIFPKGGFFAGIFKDVFAGAFDVGGKIPLGQFGLVGERGPEIVGASPTGAIVTSTRETSKALGGETHVHVTINTPDVDGFRRARSQVAADLSRAVSAGRRNL